jgi:hypothetical protein
MTTTSRERPPTARLRLLAAKLHALGPRPLFEFLHDVINGGFDPVERLERYAALDADFIRDLRGDLLPPPLRAVGERR